MTFLFEWITGCMVGLEFAEFPLEGHDIEEGNAFIIDVFIFRIIIIW